MNDRIDRSRPDFDKRKRRVHTPHNSTNIYHYIDTIARNEDLFNFISAQDARINTLYVTVDQFNKNTLQTFTIKMYIYNKNAVTTFDFLIKGIGTIPFEHLANAIVSPGDRIRFDIENVDSVREHISGLGIAFMLETEQI